MSKILSPFFFSLLGLAACGAEPSSSTAEPCSVVENDDGSATITCPDGSSTTLTDGTNGTNGTDGTTGGDGTDGAAALIRVDVEAPGASCEDGGVAIHVGLDDDGDGLLSDPEIDSTEYMCNGSDGSTGATGSAALIRIEDLEAGEECGAGGVVIYAGNDTDADAYLDDTEITDTAYVCDGETESSASAEVEFPSSTSTTVRGALGAGGTTAYFYTSGNYLSETFTGTGLSSVDQLDLEFSMMDLTNNDGCPVGSLSWNVAINGTIVGTYGYEGGDYRETIEFVESYAFEAIDGAGDDGESYELSLTSSTSVCSGGGSWNWYPGGLALLTGS